LDIFIASNTTFEPAIAWTVKPFLVLRTRIKTS